MRYRIERALGVDGDLELIFDHLFTAYREFGADRIEALQQAANRLDAIQDDLDRLASSPHQGTLRPELGQNLRNVTKRRAVFYFETHDESAKVRVLAVFFGGQDHLRRMRVRIRKAT